MRVSKLSICVMCLAMVLNSLTLFSFASESVALSNSGSTEISMKAMRSVAASEGVSLASAEGDSGQFGYNFKRLTLPFSNSWRSFASNNRFYFLSFSLDSGTYFFDFTFNTPLNYSVGVTGASHSNYTQTRSYSDNFTSLKLVVNEPLTFDLYVTFALDYDVSSITLLDYNFFELSPVEGISSGYTYSSGIIPNSTRSVFETLNPSFGNQPAGKYLVNIYHWGDSYDVRFQISDSTQSYYLPTSTYGGVTTFVYNHSGGDFTLDGSFTASNDETSIVDGSMWGMATSGVGGELNADAPLSWVFNITDIVAIPYETAADHNFGFFAPIIGFFNDHFSSMKSWIATQIDKIAGDDETQAEVDSASSALQQEVEEINQLSNNFSSQTSNLEQQFTTDFAVPDEVSGSTSSIQLIYTGLFSSLGIFSIFIWLPVVFAVIKKLLRL